MLVTLDDLRLAQHRLNGVAVHTPLVPCMCSETSHCPCPDTKRQLYLKLENFQPIGAFKVRGAYNKIVSLSEQQRNTGVIAYSSGNHALGVAYAARKLGVQATIVMPKDVSKVKLERTAALGANIVQIGHSGEERKVEAERLRWTHGYAMIPPFNDEAIIAGQGTVGLEILEDMPNVQTILVPVGGGGLISGVAALKLVRPEVRIIGVEPELASDAQASLHSGQLIGWTWAQVKRTSADGLRTQQLGDITWAHVKEYVDDIVTVSEDEIRRAMWRLAFGARLVAEPSGAVSFAAYLFRQEELPPTELNVAVISGGNTAPNLLSGILSSPYLAF